MGKALHSIKFFVILKGTIWQGIEATKEKEVAFTPKGIPFTKKWNGLEDALAQITKDGDFQNCGIFWGCMIVKWWDGKYFLERQVDIPKCKLTANYLLEEQDARYR